MFNPAGSLAGAYRAARWMGPVQEEPAVEGECSPCAPNASLLARAPGRAARSRGTTACPPTSGVRQSWAGGSKAAETIPAGASFCSSDTPERCCDSGGVHYPPGSLLRQRGDLPITL